MQRPSSHLAHGARPPAHGARPNSNNGGSGAPAELILKRCIGWSLPGAAAATAWHPGYGSGLLAYTAGCQVVLLDVQSKQQLQHFKPKRSAPRLPLGCLAFRPDGLRLAAGEIGNPGPEICIWELSTGKLLHQLKHHRHGISSVSFSHDGSLLLSAGSSYDAQLCLWDANSGVLVTRVMAQMTVLSSTFNEDSTAIMCSGKEQIRLWSLSCSANGTGGSRSRASHAVGSISLLPKPVNYKDFKGSTFTAVSTCLLPSTPQAPAAILSSSAASSSTGMYVLTGDGVLLLLKPGARAIHKSVNLQTKAALCLSVSSCLVACGCAAGVVRLFAPRTLEFKTNLPRPSPTHSAAQKSGAGQDGTPPTPPPGAGAAGAVVPAGDFPDACSCQFNREGDQLVVGYSDHTLVVWDVSDLSKITRLRCLLSHSASVWDAALLPLGTLEAGCALVTCAADGTVRVWSLDRHLRQAGGAPTTNHAQNASTLRGVLVAGGGKMPTGRTAPPLSGRHGPGPLPQMCSPAAVLTTTHGSSSGGVPAPGASDAPVQLRCLRVSRDGLHLATGDSEGNVRVYDLTSLQLLTLKEAHEGAVLSMDYSPPSLGTAGFLATAGRDCVVHVFDVGASYSLVNSLEEHSAAITSVRFSPCGSKLISASADRSLILRDILDAADCTTAMHVKMLIPSATPADSSRAGAGAGGGGAVAGKGVVYDMAVDASGSRLVLAVHGGLVRIYDLKTRELTGVLEAPPGCTGEFIRVTLDTGGSVAACACTDGSIMLYALPQPQGPTTATTTMAAAAAAKLTGPAAGRAGAITKASAIPRGQLLARSAGHAEMATCALLIGGGEGGLVSVGGDACILHWELPPAVLAQVKAAQAAAAQLLQNTQACQPSVSTQPQAAAAAVVPTAAAAVPQRARWATSTSPVSEQQPAGGVAVVMTGRGVDDGKQKAGDPSPGSPAARDQQPVWPEDSCRSPTYISNTLKRVQMGLPLQSPDKLPRWAIKNIVFPPVAAPAGHPAAAPPPPPPPVGDDALLSTGATTAVAPPKQLAGSGSAAQAGVASPGKPAGSSGCVQASLSGLTAGARSAEAGSAGAVGSVQAVPCAALWTLGVDLEEDVVVFCDEGGGSSGGARGGGGGGAGSQAAGGQRFNVKTSVTQEGEDEEAEDMNAIDDSASPGQLLDPAGAGSDVAGGHQQHDGEEAELDGAVPRSAGGSNDPLAKGRDASKVQDQVDAAAARELPPVARDLFRQFFGNLDQVSCSNTPQLLGAAPQAVGGVQEGSDARRLSLTTAVRRLASSLLAAGPAGEDMVAHATTGSPAPPARPGLPPCSPGPGASHMSGVRGPAGAAGAVATPPAAATPSGQVQGRQLPPPAAIPGEDGDGLGATSAFTPAHAYKAGCSLAQMAKDPARAANHRAGRLEGDLAKMRERLSQLQATFAQQQAKVTPWRKGSQGSRGPPSPSCSPAPIPLSFPDLAGTNTAGATPTAAAAAKEIAGSATVEPQQQHFAGQLTAPAWCSPLAIAPASNACGPAGQADQRANEASQGPQVDQDCAAAHDDVHHHAITIMDMSSPHNRCPAAHQLHLDSSEASTQLPALAQQRVPSFLPASALGTTPLAGAAAGVQAGRLSSPVGAQSGSPDLTLTSPRASTAVHYHPDDVPASAEHGQNMSRFTGSVSHLGGESQGAEHATSQVHASPLAFLQRNLAFDLEGLNTPLPIWQQQQQEVDLQPQGQRMGGLTQADATPTLGWPAVIRQAPPGAGPAPVAPDGAEAARQLPARAASPLSAPGTASKVGGLAEETSQQRWSGIGRDAVGQGGSGRMYSTQLPAFVRPRQPSPLKHLSMKEMAAVMAAAAAEQPDTTPSAGAGPSPAVASSSSTSCADTSTRPMPAAADASSELQLALASLCGAVAQVKTLMQGPQQQSEGTGSADVQSQLMQAAHLLKQLADKASQ